MAEAAAVLLIGADLVQQYDPLLIGADLSLVLFLLQALPCTLLQHCRVCVSWWSDQTSRWR
jgi:hypothetical protein